MRGGIAEEGGEARCFCERPKRDDTDAVSHLLRQTEEREDG